MEVESKENAPDMVIEDLEKTQVPESSQDVESVGESVEEKKEEDAEGKAAKMENARVQAVRGDRSGTGGVKKVHSDYHKDILQDSKLT